jgi:hypothetical protein
VQKRSGAAARAAAGCAAQPSVSSGSAGGEQPPAAPQQQQGQGWDPPYNRLDDAIATGPAAEAMQLPPPQPGSRVVAALLESLMAANPRSMDARAAIGLKVQDRTVLLDNPVGQKAGQAGPPSRRAARQASRKRRDQLGLWQPDSASPT